MPLSSSDLLHFISPLLTHCPPFAANPGTVPPARGGSQEWRAVGLSWPQGLGALTVKAGNPSLPVPWPERRVRPPARKSGQTAAEWEQKQEWA